MQWSERERFSEVLYKRYEDVKKLEEHCGLFLPYRLNRLLQFFYTFEAAFSGVCSASSEQKLSTRGTHNLRLDY